MGILLALFCMVAGATGAAARTPSVGFAQVAIPNGAEPALTAGIWYPTAAPASDQRIEGHVQRVAKDAPVRGRRLPLVVISHGGGGSFASHYDTALALARAGFVVAAVSHVGDTHDDQSQVLKLWRRPAQLSRLISYMLDQWDRHDRLNRRRIGAFGFSNGGFTVLAAAGGVPDLRRTDPYCRANPTHDLCTALAQAGVTSVAALPVPADAWIPDRRITALVVAAPAFGFTFDKAGLAQVRAPIQLWRAGEDRHQPAPFYEAAVLAALPRAPDYQVVPGAGHYDFLPPCEARLAARMPQICGAGSEFDRAAFHRAFNAELVRFFRAH